MGEDEATMGSCCLACTRELITQKGLTLKSGDIAWCKGFGPEWPVQVVGVVFDGPEDSTPYCVNFFGEKSSAWVPAAHLRSWGSRDAASVCSNVSVKWQKKMARAVQAAEQALTEEAACDVNTSQ